MDDGRTSRRDRRISGLLAALADGVLVLEERRRRRRSGSRG
ncbi:hypothetical protein [Kineococcus auxinigenes]